MSSRYAWSRSIHHLGRLKDRLAAYVVPAAFHFLARKQVNVPAKQLRQLDFHTGEAQKTRDPVGFELNEQVYVALRPKVISQG